MLPTAKATDPRTVQIDELKRQADDLGAVRSALDDAAGMARGLWISFVSLSTYLAITIGSVTHRNLLLEDPLRLPLLNVDLPLVTFFWVAPILYLVLHVYLLLHFKFTGDNVREWERLAASTPCVFAPDDERGAIEDSLRLQLPNFLIVQMLAAPRVNRRGIVRWALIATISASVIVGPVLLLMLIQLQFLPYHNEIVTWVHRFTILADLAVALLIWPLILGKNLGSWHLASIIGTVMSISAIVWLSTVVAAFPGERMYQSKGIGIRALAAFLFEGEVNEVTGRPTSWFSNVLVLPDQDFVDLDESGFNAVDVTRSFRGRHLEGAMLARADLRKVDFTGARMEWANLRQAKLQGARFLCADAGTSGGSGPTDGCTDLTATNMFEAALEGTYLNKAKLRMAHLVQARLQGATLVGAELQGANLDGANLQGADLLGVDLRFANLERAGLEAASLSAADLRGAWLVQTRLTFADLSWAKFDSAYIERADLRKADLRA
ncbi:pentapeptide repeat-containing protein [Rhizobium ruizarguesonis]